MTPEGKNMVNNLVSPYGATVATEVLKDQDIRFIKLSVEGPSEDPINVLDNNGCVLHSEEDVGEQLRRHEVARPLFRVISLSHHAPTGKNTILLEDINTKTSHNSIQPQQQGYSSAGVREPVRPRPDRLRQRESVYPPGHPSRRY
jgi:hypothetical protein